MMKALKILGIGFLALVVLGIIFPGKPRKVELCADAIELKRSAGGRLTDQQILDTGVCDKNLAAENYEMMRKAGAGK